MSDIQYTQAEGGTHIAYRVLDADPSVEVARDIVMVSGGMIPMELFEEEVGFSRMLDGLRSLGRVIVFDRRGLGLSDPITDWERAVSDQWADDLAAVIDASCAENVVLVAWEGFGVGSRYAAMHPERVTALVLFEPMVVADDDWATFSTRMGERSKANMSGELDILTEVAPSRVDDRTFREWYTRVRAERAPARRRRVASGDP